MKEREKYPLYFNKDENSETMNQVQDAYCEGVIEQKESGFENVFQDDSNKSE